MRPILLILATVISGRVLAADPDAAVVQSSLSATVGLGGVTAVSLTISNPGSADLHLRLRDSGSGLAGPGVAASILATYPVTTWNVNGSFTNAPIDFDGVAIWRLQPTTRKFVRTQLENSAVLATVTPQSAWPLLGAIAWDGQGLWAGNSLFLSSSLNRRVGRFAVSGANVGAMTNEFSFPDRGSTQAWAPNPTWDGGGCRIADALYPARIAMPAGTVTTGGVTVTPIMYGATHYAGDLWTVRLNSANKTLLSRIATGTNQRADYPVIPADQVANEVLGIAADGFGRFLVTVSPEMGKVKIIHLDSGLRGWMTWPAGDHRAITVAPGAATTLTLRLDGAVAGIGTSQSVLRVDSDAPANRRIEVPVTFTVLNQPPAPPQAVADAYATTWDAGFAVPALTGVLANDSGKGPLQAQVVAPPMHGTFALAADGSFTYDAVDGFVGIDTFTYRVLAADGLLSSPATASIAVDHAPIPDISIAPAAITAGAGPGTQTTVTVQVSNIGYGTLRVAAIDAGTGGSIGTPVQTDLVGTNAWSNSGVQFASAGYGMWVRDMQTQPNRVALVSMVDGTVMRTVNLPTATFPRLATAHPMAWDGSRLWLSEYPDLGTDAGGNIIFLSNPRVIVVDPATGAGTAVTFPSPGTNKAWYPKLAYDGQGSVWVANAGLATWKVSTSTRTTTATYPPLVDFPLSACWYDGSLWGKNQATISRYNPMTGAKLASYTWASANDATGNYGLACDGFGAFWVAGGATGAPQFVRSDSLLRGWMQAAQPHLAIAAQSSATLTLTFDAAKASPGVNTTTLRLCSNDPDQPDLVLPVTFTVSTNAAPLIAHPAASQVVLVLP
jgi:hypothetical protein